MPKIEEIQFLISDVVVGGGGTIGFVEFLQLLTLIFLNRDLIGEFLDPFRLFDDDETGNEKAVCVHAAFAKIVHAYARLLKSRRARP